MNQQPKYFLPTTDGGGLGLPWLSYLGLRPRRRVPPGDGLPDAGDTEEEPVGVGAISSSLPPPPPPSPPPRPGTSTTSSNTSSVLPAPLACCSTASVVSAGTKAPSSPLTVVWLFSFFFLFLHPSLATILLNISPRPLFSKY